MSKLKKTYSQKQVIYRYMQYSHSTLVFFLGYQSGIIYIHRVFYNF